MKVMNAIINTWKQFLLKPSAIKYCSERMWEGIVILLIVSVLAGIGDIYTAESKLTSFLTKVPLIFLSSLLFILFFSFVLWLFAKMFEGKGHFKNIFSSLLHTNFVIALLIIPYIGGLLFFLANTWLIIVDIFILKTLFKMKTVEATLTILLSIFIFVFFIVTVITIFTVTFFF